LTYFGMPRAEGMSGTFAWNPEIEERLALPVLIHDRLAAAGHSKNPDPKSHRS
jgi:hypothetical protein